MTDRELVWCRIADGTVVVVWGLLGDQILWTIRGDSTARRSPALEFLRDHRRLDGFVAQCAGRSSPTS